MEAVGGKHGQTRNASPLLYHLAILSLKHKPYIGTARVYFSSLRSGPGFLYQNTGGTFLFLGAGKALAQAP